MSRYYMQYDAHGEPRALVWPDQTLAANVVSERKILDRLEQHAVRCGNADDLYETLREQGLSHSEARARVAERFGV